MAEHATHNDSDMHEPAPWLPIPARSITSVEHPCIVKNLDKGITSLGGPVKLSKGLQANINSNEGDGNRDAKQIISVSLRPDDHFAKRLLSTAVTTNNLLLRVTVPARTGRKRRRGTSGPFLSEGEINGTSTSKSSNYVDATTIYQSLQDNVSNYQVELAGILDETHRFRAMPDLQYAATKNETMAQLREHVLPMKYSRLKQYKLNTKPSIDLTKSVGPSAEFIQMPIAFNYRFQQNVYVKYTDQGVVNLQRSLAYNSYTIIKPTDEAVPTGWKPNLPQISSLTPYLQTLITQIKAELEKRPIITRHLLYNKLGWDKRTRLRQAAVYCGYFFESGPWREALVKWGVDPRTNPVYRKYQTVSFLSYSKPGKARHEKTFEAHIQELKQMSTQELSTQHIFDGKTASTTGSLFQFCDITDPLIAGVLSSPDIRTTCAPTFQGWYHVGTWAKVTVILKHKMNAVLAGKTPDDSLYQRIVLWPESWDDKEMAATYKSEVDDLQLRQEKRNEYALMHSVRWAARNPRYAFEKMEGPGDAEDVDNQVDSDTEVPEDATEIPDTAEAILNEGEGEEKDAAEQGEDEDNDEDQGESEDTEGEEVDDFDDGLSMPVQSNGGPVPFGGIFTV